MIPFSLQICACPFAFSKLSCLLYETSVAHLRDLKTRVISDREAIGVEW